MREPATVSVTTAPTSTTEVGTTGRSNARRLPAGGCRPGNLPRGQDVAVRCRFYTIMGSTTRELRGQLDRLRDVNDNRPVAASTDWYVTWRYDYRTSAHGCAITAPVVSTRVEFTMPRWEPPETVDQDDVREWIRYLAALWRHERGHMRNGLDAANRIDDLLRGLAATSSCDELEAKADAAGEAMLDRFRERDRAYDEATDHGGTEGARLLP
jgi:predicted secreted Zn-dependent protease